MSQHTGYIDGELEPIPKELQDWLDSILPLKTALLVKIEEDHQGFLNDMKKEGLSNSIEKMKWKLYGIANAFSFKMHKRGKKWEDFERRVLQLSKEEYNIFRFEWKFNETILRDFMS